MGMVPMVPAGNWKSFNPLKEHLFTSLLFAIKHRDLEQHPEPILVPRLQRKA